MHGIHVHDAHPLTCIARVVPGAQLPADTGDLGDSKGMVSDDLLRHNTWSLASVHAQHAHVHVACASAHALTRTACPCTSPQVLPAFVLADGGAAGLLLALAFAALLFVVPLSLHLATLGRMLRGARFGGSHANATRMACE